MAMPTPLLVVDDNKELLALLTQLFEEAGYRVMGASKGKTALELVRDEKPVAAVIDLLLPDMMGFQLADGLRLHYPELPMVFVTGVFKGGKHALEARQKYKSAHYFEKPFDAQKLLAALRQVAPPPAPPAVKTEEFEVELDFDVEDDGDTPDAMELTGKIRVTGGGNISAELRGADLKAAGGKSSGLAGSRPVAAPKPSAASPGAPQQPARQGNLGDSLPGLINAFYLAKETGELGVQRGKVKKVVYFEAGHPVFALSNLAADRFGQFLVRVGKIRAEQLQDAAVVAASSKRRTGDVLVERGLLKDTERLYYVGQQVKAIIYSIFGWEDGSYQVSFKEKARAESIKLDVHPGNLIIRGVKKLYKAERLVRLAPPWQRLIPSQQPAYQLQDLALEKWEAELLTKVDGNRSNAELHRLSGGKPEHLVQAFLVSMTGLSILEVRE